MQCPSHPPRSQSNLQSRNKKYPTPGTTYLHGRVLADNLAHLALITRTVLLEHVVCFGLRRGFGIGIVEKILDTEEDLLNRNRRSPGLFFIENRQADGAGWVDIRVEQRGCKFTYDMGRQGQQPYLDPIKTSIPLRFNCSGLCAIADRTFVALKNPDLNTYTWEVWSGILEGSAKIAVSMSDFVARNAMRGCDAKLTVGEDHI